jgi:KDO2-lipid IV(A) lauroyltransferase|tara:strand:- start:449 stop:1309 length:861 start_codon:yes stop_codon:yes gene_type:complete
MITLKEKIKYAPVYAISLLPFWVIYAFARFIYFLLFYVFGYRKDVVFDNLNKSFPEKSPEDINIIAKKFYMHFCATFLESIKLLSASKSTMLQRYKILNPEAINKHYNAGESLILYGAHFANWEWMMVMPLYSKFKFMVFYQKQSSSYFDRLMVINRERLGSVCIESQSGFKSLLMHARQKVLTFTYVIGDQSPMSNSSKHWTLFLNQETAFLIGAERMAQKVNQKIYYPKVRQPKRGYYEIEFIEIPVNDSKVKTVVKYAELLEENIKEQPELWLWSHKRWKLKK